jgi:hypothetical protein
MLQDTTWRGTIGEELRAVFLRSHSQTDRVFRHRNRRVADQSVIGHGSGAFVRYSETRKEFSDEPNGKPESKQAALPAIKTMPAFDPDAEVAGLTLTIPSWMSSIERTKKTADLNSVSTVAKSRLEEALVSLDSKVQEMLKAIKEDI